MSPFENYVALLSGRASHQADHLAYVFIDRNGNEKNSFTFAELDQKARSIAATLQQHQVEKERVLIVLESDLDYISAFFGCLYAGATAVTLHPPKTKSQYQRLEGVSRNCEAKFLISTSSLIRESKTILEHVPSLATLNWIAIDTIPLDKATLWNKPEIKSNDIALLQYTSGSTSEPKGVMVSHQNLMVQGEYLKAGFDLTPEDVSVTWLPHFHDMGLILGLLESCYVGFVTYLMEPATFIRKPAIWLQTVSKYGGTWSAAPNFAYDLLVDTYQSADYEEVDLSTWKSVVNAAEPVRKKTLENFIACFAPQGFKPEFFNPSYGMAEATLEISSGFKGQGPFYRKLDLHSYQQNKAEFVNESDYSSEKTIEAISCGFLRLDTELVIVDKNQRECPVNTIGEIWIKGATVAQGYWNSPTQTKEIFNAYLKNGKGPYLRTGDLGFVDDEQRIYITGRCKDAIILYGKNYAPQDLEITIENAHPAIRKNFVAVFSAEVEGEERILSVVQIQKEFWENFDSTTVANAILNVVHQEHEVSIFEILFLSHDKIPKTTSGKIQRNTCKKLYLEDQFEKLGHYRNPLFNAKEMVR